MLFCDAAVRHEGADGLIAGPGSGGSIQQAASSRWRDTADFTGGICASACSAKPSSRMLVYVNSLPAPVVAGQHAATAKSPPLLARIVGQLGCARPGFVRGREEPLPDVHARPSQEAACRVRQRLLAAVGLGSWERIDALFR